MIAPNPFTSGLANRNRLPRSGLLSTWDMGRTNLYNWSEPLLSQVGLKTGTVTQANFTEGGLTNGIQFPAVAQSDNAAITNFNCVNGASFTLSVYVVMDDGSVPRVGAASAATDFVLVMGGSGVGDGGGHAGSVTTTVTPISGNLYRVSAWAYFPTWPGPNQNGVWRYPTQSGKGFRVTGYQIEAGQVATNYQKTTDGQLIPNQAPYIESLGPELIQDGSFSVDGRRNLLIQTEDQSQGIWTKGGVSVSSGLDPNNNTKPILLTEDGANSQHYTYQGQSVPIGTFTASVYAKTNGRAWIRLYPQTTAVGYAGFNLTTGVISATGGAQYLNSTITPMGNGWYRCSVTLTVAVAGILNITVYLSPDGNTLNYQGDGASGVYLWGFQLENASAMTAYQAVGASWVTPDVWSRGVGWTVIGGVLHGLAAVGGQYVSQNTAITSGKRYKIVYTLSNYASGTMATLIGGTLYGPQRSVNGTYTEYAISPSADVRFILVAYSGSFTGDIDNVSVREVLSTVPNTELVVNGGFTTDLTGWTNSATNPFDSVTWQSGAMQCVSNGVQETGAYNNAYAATFNCTSGLLYRVRFTLAIVSGATPSVRIENTPIGSSVIPLPTTTPGNNDLYIVATATGNAVFNVYVTSATASTFTLDNVSVQEMPLTLYLGSTTGVDTNDPQPYLEDSGRRNLFITTEPLLANTSHSAGVTQASFTENGLTNGIQFPATLVLESAYLTNFTCVLGTTYTISVFVVMNDGSAPAVGGLAGLDFALALNNVILPATSIVVSLVSGTLYRVSWTSTASTTASNTNGVVRYPSQSGKGFRVTGYQLEVAPAMTAYQPVGASWPTKTAVMGFVTDDYILSPTIPALSMAGDWTVYVCGRFDGTTGSIFSIADPTVTNQWQYVYFSSAGLIRLGQGNGDATAANIAVTPAAYSVIKAQRSGSSLVLARLDTGVSTNGPIVANMTGVPRIGLGALGRSTGLTIVDSLKLALPVVIYSRATSSQEDLRVFRWFKNQAALIGIGLPMA